MFYFWLVTGGIGISLQALLLSRMMRRRAYRDYPFLFAYGCVLLVTTSLEADAFLFNRPRIGVASSFYWVADALRQALLYLVVTGLWSRTEANRKRSAKARAVFVAGSALYVGLSFYFTYDRSFSYWMTQFSRNLGFLAVILNLVLWAALMTRKAEDKIPLMISGGMGIQMAGKALGHSLRQMSPALVTLGDLILVFSHLLCLWFWWQAFGRYPPAAA
ncbi:MAG: hypothetical protein K6T61_07450 [Bryobacteraceae bacterium]|nr:hypothetical protein [Bryobacteraceae bacterium]